VIGDLFPAARPLARARIAAASLATRVANAAVGRLVKSLGYPRVVTRLPIDGAEALLEARAAGRPVVLVSWHAGLVALVGAALVALDLDALVLRHRGGIDRAGLVHVTTQGNEARALHRAVRHARGGGLVLVVLDVHHLRVPTAGRTALLGHRVILPRGPAAIARLADAELMCIAPRLSRRGIEVHVSVPLPRDADDRVTMDHVAAWWQRWLELHPGDLWPESARAIASYPRA